MDGRRSRGEGHKRAPRPSRRSLALLAAQEREELEALEALESDSILTGESSPDTRSVRGSAPHGHYAPSGQCAVGDRALGGPGPFDANGLGGLGGGATSPSSKAGDAPDASATAAVTDTRRSSLESHPGRASTGGSAAPSRRASLESARSAYARTPRGVSRTAHAQAILMPRARLLDRCQPTFARARCANRHRRASCGSQKTGWARPKNSSKPLSLLKSSSFFTILILPVLSSRVLDERKYISSKSSRNTQVGGILNRLIST